MKDKYLNKILQIIKPGLAKIKKGEKRNMSELNEEKKMAENEQEQLIDEKIDLSDKDSAEMSEKNDDEITDESNIKESKKELQKKCDELNDKFLRLYSEFDNYRKRTIKEKQELSQVVTADVISSLLPVIDDFERALEAMVNENDNPIKEGVNLIYSKLMNSLTQKGLEPMNCKDTDFNPDFHEAIANMPAESEEKKNKIADVVAKGYLFKGKVVRYAKVVVAN